MITEVEDNMANKLYSMLMDQALKSLINMDGLDVSVRVQIREIIKEADVYWEMGGHDVSIYMSWIHEILTIAVKTKVDMSIMN